MNCGGIYINADFLYWRSENHGFSYAYERQAIPAGENNGKIVRLNPDWAPAFRAGIGWNTTHDFWDLLLNYTWYRNKVSKSRTSANGYIPLWPVSAANTGEFVNVSARSRLQLNMGDLEVGRMIFLTKTVAIRPHLGAKGGTLYQRFKSKYTVPVTGGGANTEEKFNGRNNYWGVGPRLGLNGEFHLNQGFSLKGIFAGALLYGKTKAGWARSVLQSGSTNYTTSHDFSDNFYQLVPHMQLALGLQWQACFWYEKMLCRMSVMWETNYWWNQFNLPVALNGVGAPLPTVGNQPLTTEGLTVNLEWGF